MTTDQPISTSESATEMTTNDNGQTRYLTDTDQLQTTSSSNLVDTTVTGTSRSISLHVTSEVTTTSESSPNAFRETTNSQSTTLPPITPPPPYFNMLELILISSAGGIFVFVVIVAFYVCCCLHSNFCK